MELQIWSFPKVYKT